MINSRADSEERERSRNKAERVRADDLKCKDLAAEYQSDYAAHNATPPLIRSDEWSDDYHRRLLRGLQRRLSPRSDLADPTLFNEIKGGVLANFARMVREEAAKEAHTPSPENLPESVHDPRALRERTDEMGRRTIEFHAKKKSFISELNRAPQHRAAHLQSAHRRHTLGRCIRSDALSTRGASKWASL